MYRQGSAFVRRLSVTSLLAACAGLSCTLSGCESRRGTPDLGATEAIEMQPVDGALGPISPGSPGAAECAQDQDCREQTQQVLTAWSQADTGTLEISVVACEVQNIILETDSVSGPACQCQDQNGTPYLIGPLGIGCAKYDRTGGCLFNDDEFVGCEPDDASSCAAACGTLIERLNADNAKQLEASVVSATCDEGNCSTVVEIDGQCFANDSYRRGRAYSCADTPEQILAAEAEAIAPAVLVEQAQEYNPYPEGFDGNIGLGAARAFYGTYGDAPSFGAGAQFFRSTGTSASADTVIDPLEGVDDCGVTKRGNLGTSGQLDFFAADELVLLDGGKEHPFINHMTGFPNYGLGLTELGVEPRFGEDYGVRASGAGLTQPFVSNELHLPEELTFPGLQALTHLDAQALTLRWSGAGAEPLRLLISFWVPGKYSSLGVECLMKDDGEFTIPMEILQAAPNGFARLSFTRRARNAIERGEDALILEGNVVVSHELTFGERCDTPAVYDACLVFAKHERTLRDTCGPEETRVPARPDEVICPDYLQHSCHSCPEFYQCQVENWRCENGGIVVSSNGCSCD